MNSHLAVPDDKTVPGHTPGPWHVGGGDLSPASEARVIRGPNGEYIARVNLTLADAEHIVRCANAYESHNQMLGALREAEMFIAGVMPRFMRDREDAIDRVLPIIRAAIAKATGEQP